MIPAAVRIFVCTEARGRIAIDVGDFAERPPTAKRERARRDCALHGRALISIGVHDGEATTETHSLRDCAHDAEG